MAERLSGILSRFEYATCSHSDGRIIRFWFRAAMTGKDARNATFKVWIGTSLHALIYDEPRDVSRFRAFSCRVFVDLNAERREKGKHKHVYPFCKTSVINKYLTDNSIDILYKHPNDIKWVPYNSKHVANYKEVHHAKGSGVSTF